MRLIKIRTEEEFLKVSNFKELVPFKSDNNSSNKFELDFLERSLDNISVLIDQLKELTPDSPKLDGKAQKLLDELICLTVMDSEDFLIKSCFSDDSDLAKAAFFTIFSLPETSSDVIEKAFNIFNQSEEFYEALKESVFLESYLKKDKIRDKKIFKGILAFRASRPKNFIPFINY